MAKARKVEALREEPDSIADAEAPEPDNDKEREAEEMEKEAGPVERDPDEVLLKGPDNVEMVGVEGREIHRSEDGFFRFSRSADRDLIGQLVRHSGFEDVQ